MRHQKWKINHVFIILLLCLDKDSATGYCCGSYELPMCCYNDEWCTLCCKYKTYHINHAIVNKMLWILICSQRYDKTQISQANCMFSTSYFFLKNVWSFVVGGFCHTRILKFLCSVVLLQSFKCFWKPYSLTCFLVIFILQNTFILWEIMNFNFDIYRRIAMLWSFFEFQSCLRVAYKNLFSKRFYLFLS